MTMPNEVNELGKVAMTPKQIRAIKSFDKKGNTDA